MSGFDFAGGTVTMTVPYETAQKFIELFEKDFGDELFALGNEFCVGKGGHTAKYLCVEVDGVGGFYNNFKERKDEAKVHAYWTTKRTWQHDGEIYCSACENDAPTEGDYRQVKTKYCPNCGAIMDGKRGK